MITIHTVFWLSVYKHFQIKTIIEITQRLLKLYVNEKLNVLALRSSIVNWSITKMRKWFHWPFGLLETIMFPVAICRYGQHVWCACWTFKWLHLAQIVFLKIAEGKFWKGSVEVITTNTTHLETRMVVFWLIQDFDLECKKNLERKTEVLPVLC